MKILIIGGTRFVGRAISESLLAHGHSLTLFHRGKTNPDYLPEATHVIGDRETDIERLTGTWDVVIDTCGYYPRIVKISANHLQDKVKHYLFISTISVYSSTSELGITEAAPLQQLDDPTTEDMQSEENAYGGLKVLCENVVTSVYGERSIIVRPGLIVGPYDPTNRFTYWLPRIRKSGRILAPGDGSMPSQFIDVRDL
ncbi:MAG: NAD-dependent epimerase/dehydratase family protein, partial [Candidatus Kariarchaeaceae archaeon]